MRRVTAEDLDMVPFKYVLLYKDGGLHDWCLLLLFYYLFVIIYNEVTNKFCCY